MDQLLTDPIKFDMPDLQQPVQRLLVNLLVQAVSDLRVFVDREHVGHACRMQASISYAWIMGWSDSRLTMHDVADACGCEFEMLRDRVIEQFSESRLKALRHTYEFQQLRAQFFANAHEAVAEILY